MRIEAVQGDLTRHPADVLVTPANPRLRPGGGLDMAFRERGGPSITDECRRLRSAAPYRDGVPVGQAVATTAGELPARALIHAVAPPHSEEQSAALASCYRESLRIAHTLGARTIAFPALSTGHHAWPLDDAAKIAHMALTSTPYDLDQITFVLPSEESVAVFAAELAEQNPTDQEIEQTLAAQPATIWATLSEQLSALTPEDLRTTYGGGEKQPSGAITTTYPIYTNRVERLLSLLYELKAVTPFDWPTWYRLRPEGFVPATPADAAREATSLIRGERFCDGLIASALEDGTFVHFVTLLATWHRTRS